MWFPDAAVVASLLLPSALVHARKSRWKGWHRSGMGQRLQSLTIQGTERSRSFSLPASG